MRWLVLLTEFDIQQIAQKFFEGSIVANHLVSLPMFDDKVVDDIFPNEEVATTSSPLGCRIYFDDASNHSGYRIGALLTSPLGDHIPR